MSVLNSNSSKMLRSEFSSASSRTRASISSCDRAHPILMVARNFENVIMFLDWSSTFVFNGSFQLVGMFQQVLDASEFGDQFLSSLFSYTRTSGNVVGSSRPSVRAYRSPVRATGCRTWLSLLQRPSLRNLLCV